MNKEYKKIREVMKKITQTTGLEADRYDTDDEMVLTVFDNNGGTFDIRIEKIGQNHSVWHTVKPTM